MPDIEVLLLTQQHCAYCDDAKALLERLSSDFPLHVQIVDISTPEGQRLAAQGGVMFPPGLFLDQAPFSYGRPSERKLRKALRRKLADAPDQSTPANT
ncbi:glutaredoxin family protein [Paraconexibacter antarcticus]|uniref:Glutaredoxin family protein n=1 Tax=Paraconexibacter antarcticus TaxID=2949664 RepID=A0ABY5DTJ0_9ACTN|nr:glutaredoxin family protein [Paraconexibacter antarcticus]UTI63990.1 glutaredoxin family protein [Paraconexibacter antarcticus]